MANDPLLANAVIALYATALDAAAWPQALAALAQARCRICSPTVCPTA